MTLNYIKAEPISLKHHPAFNEAWLRDIIVDDPSILGFGDLAVKDVEKRQPHAGRLDILLHEPESEKRYEVEIQLGVVDPSHIIRTIEYWDIERKRYPQYDHCAVIVAEDITSRFLNVINLFNSAIPIVAIQLSALKVDDYIVLNFVKVLDEIELGDEEEEISQPKDRAYWENKKSRETVQMADRFLELLHKHNPNLRPNYTMSHIGLQENGKVNNFVVHHPHKKHLNITVRVDEVSTWQSRFEETDIVVLDSKKNRLRLQITPKAQQEHIELLEKLIEAVWKYHQR